MHIEVVEILRRSQQGITRPFLCRCSDNEKYYLKGRNAGRKARVAEWVAGRIGQQFGLPIPQFAIADVPKALVEEAPNEEFRELGHGPAFASRLVPDVAELRWNDVERVDAGLRRRILVFDCWVANGDRQLWQGGGNPNLLRSPLTGAVWAIDHNLAFGGDSVGEIRGNHAFAASSVLAGSAEAEGFAREMGSILETAWPALWRELPEEWLEDQDLISRERVEAVLRCFETHPEEFWANR